MNEEQREVAERLIVRLDTAPAPLRDPDLNDAAAALLRELAEVPVSEPVAWLVMDESGYVQHAASWRDAAHEHINDAINEHDLVCARTWRVVPVYAAPQQRKPPSDAFVYKVVRSVQPNLADTCKAWAEQFDECKHWLDAAHGITGEPE